MSNAHTVMSAAIKNSTERTNELKKTRPDLPYIAHGTADSEIGEVYVTFAVVESVCLGRETHYRKKWRLNGKRIAVKKLEALLDA